MTELLPLPASYTELRELPVRRKGEWKGAGWLMAVLVWLGYCGPLVLAFVLSFWHPAWAVLALARAHRPAESTRAYSARGRLRIGECT